LFGYHVIVLPSTKEMMIIVAYLSKMLPHKISGAYIWGSPSLLTIGYRRLLPPGVKRLGREANLSLPCSTEVKNA
jgi:hypothetical protein